MSGEIYELFSFADFLVIHQPAIWKLERQKAEANEVGRVPLLSEMKVMAVTENFGVIASANRPQ